MLNLFYYHSLHWTTCFYFYFRLPPVSESPRKIPPNQGTLSHQQGQIAHSPATSASLNHPPRPLSTLDSGMYTSSDDEGDDHDEPSSTNTEQGLESHQSPPRMKFTTFGKIPQG